MGEDVPAILELIHGLANYEREPDAVKMTEEVLIRDGFPSEGQQKYFEVMMVDWKEDSDSEVIPVAFALYFYTYSTWEGRVLYLEDLFVKPEYRGAKIGTSLLLRLAEIAVEHDCKRWVLVFIISTDPRFQWQVLYWNEPSIQFYISTGAKEQSDWRIYRLNESGIHHFIQVLKSGEGQK